MSSILVAYANPDLAKKIAAVLHSGGLHASGICISGAQVTEFMNRHYHGGVVVCGERLLDMQADHLLHNAGSGYDFVFIRKSPPGSSGAGSLTLLQPIKRVALIATVNMLLNLSNFTSLEVRKKLAAGDSDEKELIASAKNLLISRNCLTEMQAHRFIQKKSMDTGKKMVETALIILNS